MLQLLLHPRDGKIELLDVPAPQEAGDRLLIRSRVSLVSPGTERSLVQFGKAGLLEKAKSQPDKVRQVLDKIRTDGLMPTIEAVRSKLDQPIALGYCNVGEVVATDRLPAGWQRGDRVVSNAGHAELVSVPPTLAARIPDQVGDEDAAFTVLTAVGLQGVRLAAPTLGENFVVIGAGLVGLLTVQLLRAHGCNVLAIDLDESRLELARSFGASVFKSSGDGDALAAADAFTKGRGADGVLITASTSSSGPVRDAARMSRKRGRIILVGVSGLELSRADFYEKELSFQVSCSYGPGRYDPEYEEKGRDYPFGHVRWTAKRNFEAVLGLMADGRLVTKGLVSRREPFLNAASVYEELVSDARAIGMLFDYPVSDARVEMATSAITAGLRASREGVATFGVIGAGNYALRVLLPALRGRNCRIKTIVSRNGLSAALAARKFAVERSSSRPEEVLDDPEITAVVIATRHDSHARLAAQALRAGKHVFVEKPLAISREGLAEVREAHLRSPNRPVLMVGFNRRFAPHIRRVVELLSRTASAKAIQITVNAGSLPPSHWTRDPAAGGGRVLGEGCHFVDLLRHLAGRPLASLQAVPIGGPSDDSATITARFADRSVGTVHYLASGHPSFPKERVEVFCGGGVLQLDNFRTMKGFGWPGFSSMRLWRQDKGNRACMDAFIDSVSGSSSSEPIPCAELLEVAEACLSLSEPPALRRADGE